ncbi:AzlC family ABC transporter permease [Nocardioidaceae bacterium]|nr:AzlC family ABC transporter permease [Nocardioidaceae bacterium]
MGHAAEAGRDLLRRGDARARPAGRAAGRRADGLRPGRAGERTRRGRGAGGRAARRGSSCRHRDRGPLPGGGRRPRAGGRRSPTRRRTRDSPRPLGALRGALSRPRLCHDRRVSSPVSPASAQADPWERFTRGVRLGLPYAAVGFVLSLSFGVLALQAGFSVVQAIVTAALVFAGSAQFAALAVVASGGTVLAAVSAASLMNARFLAMGVALAPSLPGPPWARALQGLAVVDSSWALANNRDGTFDRWLLFGTTLPQYLGWVAGTVAGCFAGGLVQDTEAIGLDAVFPTFFLALVMAELRDPRARPVAAAGVVIALALVPVAPPGIPILAAAAATLLALAPRGRTS